MKSSYVELYEIGKSRVTEEEIDTSNLKENEVIVEADYSMISAGTELSRAFALKKGFKYPVRPGYSMVGTVIDKGSNIDVEIGDKVFCGAIHASVCRYMVNNKTQGNFLLKLPNDIDLKDATAINLCLIAMQGVNISEVKLNDTVAIFGLGNIGILCGLMYQKLGCKVIGLDMVENRCKLASEMGIKIVSSNKDQEQVINELTNNKGVDIAVDVTGVSPAIVSAINVTKKYGQVVLLGSPRVGYECDITPVLNRIHMKNLKVLGAFNETCPVNNAEGRDDSVYKNFENICQLIKNKDIDISKLISRAIDPKDCEQAYYDLMYNKDKVNCIVYDWSNYK